MRWKTRITIITPKGNEKVETNNAYEKFCYYRDLGEKRSYQKVADHYNISLPAIKNMAKKYDWQNRLHEMVDAELEQKRKENARKKKATVKRHKTTGKKSQEDIQKLIDNILDNSMIPDDEKAKAVAPLYHQLFKAIDVERTANHLPKQYNDKQKVEATNEINGELKLQNKLLFADKKSYQKTITELEDLLE